MIIGDPKAPVPVGFGVGSGFPTGGVFAPAVFIEDPGVNLEGDDVAGESPDVTFVAGPGG